MSQPIATKEFDFGILEFYDGYVISTHNEGVHISAETHNKIMRTINSFFGKRKFVYIANRKHSYSVDVMVYYEVVKVKHLLAIAVVNYLGSSVRTFSMETHFLDKPSKEFDALEEAIEWAKSFL